MASNNFENNGKNSQKVIFKRSRRFSKRQLITVCAILCFGLAIGIILFFVNNNESSKNNYDPKTAFKYEESFSSEAQASFLAGTLESFWLGGNTNGVMVASHKYYPTADQVSDKKWSTVNLKLTDEVIKLLESKKITYEPSDCKESKCGGFQVKQDGKVISKNISHK